MNTIFPRLKAKMSGLFGKPTSKPGDGETAMLIAYLLPFSYSPVFMLSAITTLDEKAFPKTGKIIKETITSETSKGIDPLTALERASKKVGRNTIVGQLLQSYVRITRTVGQSSYATLTFFERAIKAIETSWSKYTTITKILAESYIGVWGLVLLAFILSLTDPTASNYMGLLPITTFAFLALSLLVYVVAQPPLGNPYNGIRQNRYEPLIYYLTLLSSIIVATIDAKIAVLITGVMGVIVEYRFRIIKNSYYAFLNKLAETVNNVKLGFPASKELLDLIENNPLSGTLKRLLEAMEKGARRAGDIGFKNALQYIHELLEFATRKYRDALLTSIAFSIILSFMPSLVAHGIDVISSLQTNAWNPLSVPTSSTEIILTVKPFTLLVPLIPLLSIRPRHPPLIISSFSLMLYELTSTHLLN